VCLIYYAITLYI